MHQDPNASCFVPVSREQLPVFPNFVELLFDILKGLYTLLGDFVFAPVCRQHERMSKLESCLYLTDVNVLLAPGSPRSQQLVQIYKSERASL